MEDDFLYRIWQVLDRTPYPVGDPENGPRCHICRVYGHGGHCPISVAYATLCGVVVNTGLYLMDRWSFFECQEPITL